MIILNESDTDYHNNAALGSSDIRAFLQSSQLLRDMIDGVCVKKKSDAMSFGTLAHMYFLEPARYSESVIIKPEGMDFRTKEGRAWKEANEGKVHVSEADSAKLFMMKQRIPAQVVSRITSGQSEVTVRVNDDGLDLQCRVDHWYREDGTNEMYDLKTTSNIDDIGKSVMDYGYHIQSAFYGHVTALAGVTSSMQFIFCETDAPFRWRIVDLSHDLQVAGEEAVAVALAGIAACKKSDNWTDKKSIYETIEMPTWAKGKKS